jgi:tRNA(Ile)-lysidine synthase
MEDPTNESRAFLRNRVRRDLLPALREVRPAIEYELDDIARRAAAVRRDVERYAEHITSRRADRDALTVDAVRLTRHSRAELSLLWPAIASRIGVAMDWRGTERASAFTMQGGVGARMPLSGGWEIARERDRFELRRAERSPRQQARLPLAPGARWDAWRFEPAAVAQQGEDAWVAQLPLGALLSIRGWQPGDRMRSGVGRRRVKRFLSDARVNGTNRGVWPVVLADDEIVWIPGVCRSDAAAVRPGRPGVLYRCELDRR